MLTQILLGLALGVESETVLVQSVVALLVASLMGWIIGKLADAMVRESFETRKQRTQQQAHPMPMASSEAA
jgi:tetrahydromethanopterin S-methyltransferase subunit C